MCIRDRYYHYDYHHYHRHIITVTIVFFQATILAKVDSLKTGTKHSTTTTSNPIFSIGSPRRISTTHHHHKKVQDLLKKYPDIYNSITSTLFDEFTLTHHDDILSILSTKYPVICSEISNDNNNDINNNRNNDGYSNSSNINVINSKP